MARTLIVVILAFISGCTTSHLVYQDKAQTIGVLEKLNPGDPITLTLADGTAVQGNFFSYKDGLITLKIGDFFRETEIDQIHEIEFKSEKKYMKALVLTLMSLTGGYIIYTFISNH